MLHPLTFHLRSSVSAGHFLLKDDVVEKLKSVYDYFSDYSYIICTGGTYDAWKEDFDEVFKDMKTLQIISGNANDPSLSNVFSNVRGYYYNLINHVR